MGAQAEPVVLRHTLDQQGFGARRGCMLVAQAFEERIEVFLLFPSKDHERAGETMAEIVARGGRETFRSFRACGALRIGLVRCDLSWRCHDAQKVRPGCKGASRRRTRKWQKLRGMG